MNLAIQQKDLGIINVCSGNPISIHELVNNWINENKWSIKLNRGFYAYPDYEPMHFWGDNSKLLSIIN